MHEFDELLPEAVRRELRREAAHDMVARARVMSAVRQAARRPQRGGWLSPAMGSALAASVLVAVAGGAIATMPRTLAPTLAPAGDSTIGAAIRDTLLLVRFAITAPNAARVAVVGDFNGWRPGTTLLARDEHGAWRADVALARGNHRYAFVVDDTQWVADSTAPAASAPDGRAASRLVIPAPE